ncbi:MAG: Hint domain-containing homing endonuclease [Ignavibacteriaceae bacterium]
MDNWPHQERALDASRGLYGGFTRSWTLVAPPGAGKCFQRGTPILMADGTIRPVEDIQECDFVMGADSIPRMVTGLARGTEMMYRVSPVKGDSYVVNESHILSLQSTDTGNIVNISVRDYLLETNWFRERHKGYRSHATYPSKEVHLDPYFLGVWLADGNSANQGITNPEPEVREHLETLCAMYGLQLAARTNSSDCPTYGLSLPGGRWSGPNQLLDGLRYYDLIQNKHIPLDFLANDFTMRRLLLAGIIDGDGHKSRNGTYDIIFKRKLLAEQTVQLIRSLGFAAYLTETEKGIKSTGFKGTYYRISASGINDTVPMMVPRKKSSTRQQIKSVLRTGVTIERVGVGEYFGFQITGDGLFLLGDHTVVHNSHVMRQIAIPAAQKDKKVHIYCHRIMLTDQTIAGLEKAGVEFGVIAAGLQYRDYENLSANIQVCMLPTVYARMNRAGFHLPKADILIIDERHQQTGEMADKVFSVYKNWEAKEIGFTATPVGLRGQTDRLVDAGSYSEMLKCGAHLPIDCRGVESPDTSSLKHGASGEYSSNAVAKVMRVPTIFGRVYDYWQILNPTALPAIGYGPDVAGCRWFTELFAARGVPCAHIDGEKTVFATRNPNGIIECKEYETDESTRKEIMDGSRDGNYKIVWNRFVLREAIDMPWLYHCILATCMGAESTYLQSVGRLQRFFAAYSHVMLADHGGNIDRHGMPDEDRNWSLDDTNNTRRKERKERIKNTQGAEAEPICCPQCMAYRTHGAKCPNCGHMHKMSVRWVRQTDDQLVKKVGRVLKYKKPKNWNDHFTSALYAMGVRGGTVSQAVAIAQAKTREMGDVPPNEYRQDILDNWSKTVRQAYPWADPRRKKKKEHAM